MKIKIHKCNTLNAYVSGPPKQYIENWPSDWRIQLYKYMNKLRSNV